MGSQEGVCHPTRTSHARARLRSIQQAACELVLERGYDGFTMEELAETVGVSRRTLFNHVPDKASAVLGPMETELSPAIETFRKGGPKGVLMTDIVTTIDAVMEDLDDPSNRAFDQHQLVERAVQHDGKLAQLALKRFEHLASLLAQLICEREGWPEDDLRSRTIASTMLALIKLTFDEFGRRSAKSDFRTVFHEVLEADLAVRSMSTPSSMSADARRLAMSS